MADSDNNLVLEHLRAIRGKLDKLEIDGGETRTRLAHLEEQGAHVLGLYASLSGRIGRLAEAVERIPRRLDLVEAERH
jgi:predicted protein tyrosine phosphatase